MNQHKLRGWATVWRVTTADGAWFAKQNCPLQQVEVPLMATLSRLTPDRIVPVAAAADGFLLTADQGPVFESVGDDLDSWVRLAREAAELQRELVAAPRGAARRRDDRAGAGGGARLPRGPDRAARCAGPRGPAPTRARGRRPAARPPARRTRLGRRGGCAGSARSPSTTTTCTTNVCEVDGRLRFFDFGDSLLTEPLGVLLIPLNILGASLDADGDDPRLWRVADAALEVWSDLAPLADLRAACRRRSSSAGWDGSSRGCAASRHCSTTSSPSGARSRRPGSGPSTRTRPSAPASSTRAGGHLRS